MENKITATVEPANATDKTVAWASSDETVVTVTPNGNECTVTAQAEGTATVTATTKDGGKTADCVVTVKKQVVDVSGVSVTPSTLSLEVA